MSENYTELRETTKLIRDQLNPDVFNALSQLILGEKFNVFDIPRFGIENRLGTNPSGKWKVNEDWLSFQISLTKVASLYPKENWEGIFLTQ